MICSLQQKCQPRFVKCFTFPHMTISMALTCFLPYFLTMHFSLSSFRRLPWHSGHHGELGWSPIMP